MTMFFDIPPERMNPRHRILLVDDNPDLLELNAVALIRSGYNVDTAEDCASAWNALHNANLTYNLLITDNKMPRVTGLDLIKNLRSEEMTLPIILASGTIPTAELEENPWLRLDATLPKPFTTEKLLETVRKVLRALEDTADNFQLFRNCVIAGTKKPHVEKAASASALNQEKPMRILVVDDDSDTRQLSVDVLAAAGYKVEDVKDGAAGWKALQANVYDLVVTDNKMPNMTGIEMIEKLRSSPTAAIPIIMATAYLPIHEFIRKPSLKPDAMLQRPFSNDDLLETVKNVLRPDGRNRAQKKPFSS